MLRLSLIGTFALFSMAVAVSAQSGPDCGTAYKALLDKIKREQDAGMSGERVASLHRKAQRIYDACQTGHLPNPRRLFEELDREK
jgi:hypothetical protein